MREKKVNKEIVKNDEYIAFIEDLYDEVYYALLIDLKKHGIIVEKDEKFFVSDKFINKHHEKIVKVLADNLLLDNALDFSLFETAKEYYPEYKVLEIIPRVKILLGLAKYDIDSFLKKI